MSFQLAWAWSLELLRVERSPFLSFSGFTFFDVKFTEVVNANTPRKWIMRDDKIDLFAENSGSDRDPMQTEGSLQVVQENDQLLSKSNAMIILDKSYHLESAHAANKSGPMIFLRKATFHHKERMRRDERDTCRQLDWSVTLKTSRCTTKV